MAFETESVFVEFADILPVKQLPKRVKKTKKYLQISASIREVGIIEPPAVARERHRRRAHVCHPKRSCAPTKKRRIASA